MSSLRVTEVISSRNTATLFLHRANALPHIHILIIGRHRQHGTLTNFTKKEREKPKVFKRNEESLMMIHVV